MTVTNVKTVAHQPVAIRARVAAPPKPKILMDDVINRWLEDEKQRVKISTISTYRAYAQRMVRPFLGTLPAEQIGDREVLDLMALLTDEDCGYAKKTVHLAVNVLKQILVYGRAYGVTADPELCVLRQCSGAQHTANALTKAEQKNLLAALGDCERPADLGVLLSLKTGLRVGEACGLQWGDIDFGAGVLYIRRTVMRIILPDNSTEVHIGAPKSESSRRQVPLSNDLLKFLKARRQADNIFITSGSIKPQEPSALQKHFKVILHRAGVRDINYHTLRHTFATQCIDKGFDAKSLSMILGHSDVSTTLNTYVHPSMEKLRKMMQHLE